MHHKSATDVDFHGLTKTNLAPPQKKHASSVVKRDKTSRTQSKSHTVSQSRQNKRPVPKRAPLSSSRCGSRKNFDCLANGRGPQMTHAQ